jgi:KilA-N domain
VSLKDLHAASGFSVHRTPTQWQRLENTKRMMVRLVEKTKTNGPSKGKHEVKSVIYAKEGRSGDTFAHPVLALSYAEFLSADLAIEVREVFLRYKAADPKLADEILQRASPEANEWAGARAIGRSERVLYTGILKSHGVVGPGYALSTNAIYRSLFDADAKDIRAKKGLKKSAALRDNMETKELVFITAAEHLAGERINDVGSRGNQECAIASMKSASFIRQAIDADRADRKRPTR